MTDDPCAAVRDQLPELALGVLTGSARADVVEHLATCRQCRTELDELSGTADALSLLAPEREPPASFASRAVAAIDDARRSGRRRWRTRMVVALAAAAAILVGGVFVGRATVADGHSRDREASEVRERTMIGRGGLPAGQVFLYRGNQAWAVVSVDYGTLPAGTYSVATAREPIGTVTVDTAGRGAWGGQLPRGNVRAVRIVDSAGHVLCEARFDRSPSADGTRT
jgi:predicted anti-sigma-YlaC factor YlaD